jgi:hypothetical protein
MMVVLVMQTTFVSNHFFHFSLQDDGCKSRNVLNAIRLLSKNFISREGYSFQVAQIARRPFVQN